MNVLARSRGSLAARCRVLVVAVLGTCFLGLDHASAQAQIEAGHHSSTIVSTTASTPPNPQVQISNLKNQVSDLQEIVQLVLAPIAILIGILSLGGAVGVVFSFRDQRRLSQLHQLAVSSEVSSQRRVELSYSSFLEESQKTLTLVNQTLALAREATDQAAHTMERKAAASLARIETNARDLLQPLLDKGEFESIVGTAEIRTNLETVAGELRAIEGYLLLQDIELQPYSGFVKGIAQYLADDTTGSLRTLRQAAQDSSVRELQLFAIYWDAYLNIALGNYAEAIHVFELGEENLPERAMERIEFERMIDDATFFRLASEHSDSEPADRLRAVAHLLIDLEQVSDTFHEGNADTGTRTSHEIADTRGDILSWIAYRADHLHEPLADDAITQATALVLPAESIRADGTAAIKAVMQDGQVERLSAEALRAWVLTQAQITYRREHAEENPDLALAFGSAECEFMLRTSEAGECIRSYQAVERKAIAELGSHHEHRKSVELAQIALVCACRLLYLHSENAGQPSGDVRNEETEVRNAHLRVQEALSEMRDHKVTINSPLQRRPLNSTEFSNEAQAIRRQALREAS